MTNNNYKRIGNYIYPQKNGSTVISMSKSGGGQAGL